MTRFITLADVLTSVGYTKIEILQKIQNSAQQFTDNFTNLNRNLVNSNKNLFDNLKRIEEGVANVTNELSKYQERTISELGYISEGMANVTKELSKRREEISSYNEKVDLILYGTCGILGCLLFIILIYFLSFIFKYRNKKKHKIIDKKFVSESSLETMDDQQNIIDYKNVNIEMNNYECAETEYYQNRLYNKIL